MAVAVDAIGKLRGVNFHLGTGASTHRQQRVLGRVTGGHVCDGAGALQRRAGQNSLYGRTAHPWGCIGQPLSQVLIAHMAVGSAALFTTFFGTPMSSGRFVPISSRRSTPRKLWDIHGVEKELA